MASAGFGTDHIAAMELLNSVKSAGGLAVAILLKPFSFEGQRRVEEVILLIVSLFVYEPFFPFKLTLTIQCK